MGLEYDATEWRFLLTHPAEVSKQIFYIMGIVSLSIPIGHSVQMKEKTTAWKICCLLLTTIENKWLICEDLKVVGLVLGFQGEYTKYPCFLCLWDSQVDDQHYQTKGSH